VDGQDINCPTFLVENVHIEPLARQVQTGVQHGWSLLGAGCVDNPTLSPVRFLFMTFHRETAASLRCGGRVQKWRVTSKMTLTVSAVPAASAVPAGDGAGVSVGAEAGRKARR
jgi:hypothetical protein